MNLGFRNNKIDSYWEEKLTELANNHKDVSIIYLYGEDTLKIDDIDILITTRFRLKIYIKQIN